MRREGKDWERRMAIAAVLAVGGMLFAAAHPGQGKPFTPGKDGWLTLFDGSDVAKWQKSKDASWALKDGTLVGTKGEMVSHWHWTDFELAGEFRGAGSLRFRVSLAPMPDQAGYVLGLADGSIRTADGRVVARGKHPASDAWRSVRLLVSKGKFTVDFDGKTVAEGGDNTYPAMGYLALVADGRPFQARRLRIRPLNREKHENIPAPNSACYVCHANFDGEPISKVHLKEEVPCAKCHGPSLAHRSDEDNVTTPDVMFTRAEVDAACLECHKRHKREKNRKDGRGPGRPPDDATCTDCHGNHKGRN
ncbi:MAG: DUF1080 domain-containing protein [Candidatus Brocadiae bacterium]|nr:DUF1080 domain-containing protein [Candidatus Brocadiia bacterium]